MTSVMMFFLFIMVVMLIFVWFFMGMFVAVFVATLCVGCRFTHFPVEDKDFRGRDAAAVDLFNLERGFDI